MASSGALTSFCLDNRKSCQSRTMTLLTSFSYWDEERKKTSPKLYKALLRSEVINLLLMSFYGLITVSNKHLISFVLKTKLGTG